LGLKCFFDGFAVVREVPPHAATWEVPRVALPTLIQFGDTSLRVKFSGKGIFWAFATGFLYASVRSDLASPFPGVLLS